MDTACDCDVSMEAPCFSPSRTLQNSAFSTQSGFLFVDAERDSYTKDASLHWSSGAVDCMHATANDVQDYDATCTSRSIELPGKQPHQKVAEQSQGASAVSCAELVPMCQDSGMTDQDSKSHQWQRLPSREHQQALRAGQQQEELMLMIRNELALEQELSAPCGFLEQPEASGEHITPQMRMIVCSWLSEVACEFNMQQETLFLAVALMDRFMCGTKGVPRSVLQLVAVACMLLASKQDEVVHPSVEELTDIAANCFQAQDLLRMERVLLDGLSWRIKTPTAYTFLHLFTQTTAVLRAASQASCTSSAGGLGRDQLAAPSRPSSAAQAKASTVEPMQGTVVAKAAYLTELALLDYSSLAFRPSQVAAAALLLAQSWSEQGAAPQEIHQISGYGPADLHDCLGRLLHLHQCAAACGSSDALAPFTFIKEKYSQDCWLQASLQDVPAAVPDFASLAYQAEEGDMEGLAPAPSAPLDGAFWPGS